SASLFLYTVIFDFPLSFFFFFSSRRRHTRSLRDWSSDVCSSDLRRRDAARHDGRCLQRSGEEGRRPNQAEDGQHDERPWPASWNVLKKLSAFSDQLAARENPLNADG